MKNSVKVGFALLAIGTAFSAVAADSKVAPSPNGITLPEGYKDWRVIAPSYRTDKKHIRVILGNDIAVAAARPSRGRTAQFLGSLCGRKKRTPPGRRRSSRMRSGTPNSW